MLKPTKASRLTEDYSVLTTPDFWDCECTVDYIHYKAHNQYCIRCKCISVNQPDSRVIEVFRAGLLTPKTNTLSLKQDLEYLFKEHRRLSNLLSDNTENLKRLTMSFLTLIQDGK